MLVKTCSIAKISAVINTWNYVQFVLKRLSGCVNRRDGKKFASVEHCCVWKLGNKKNASFCARFYRLFIHTFYQSAVADLPWGKITNSIRTLYTYTRSFKTTQNSINSFSHSSCTRCVCVHGIMCKW